MADTIFISPETFALGHFAFRLASRCRQDLDEARALYSSTSSDAQYHLFDLDQSRALNAQHDAVFHSLITQAYRFHDGHLYIDGCAMITDRSELVLMAGASHAGKTTLTVAAAQKLGWKVLSEDLVLIDLSLKGIVPFNHPLSLRPGAPQMIQDATGLPLPNLYLDRWLACGEMFYTGAVREPKFDYSILLQAGIDNSDFQESSADAPEFLRGLLPLSNALYVDDGLESLRTCIAAGQCSILRGGTLGERLEFLSQLTSRAMASR